MLPQYALVELRNKENAKLKAKLKAEIVARKEDDQDSRSQLHFATKHPNPDVDGERYRWLRANDFFMPPVNTRTADAIEAAIDEMRNSK